MRIKHKLLLIATLIGTTPVLANQVVDFSPYADLTINAHWDSQYQDMVPMDLATISQITDIKSYHLAFITDAGQCQPAWGSQATYSATKGWGSHLTDQLRTNKVNYIISFGGASGDDLSKNCSNADLMTAYKKIIGTYQPQGLDFDIENGTANVPNMMKALVTIQHDYPTLKISFTLPVLPTGLTPEYQPIVQQAQAAGLDFSVNIMAMDYGPSFNSDMGQYAIDAATNLFLFLKNLYPNKLDSEIWNRVEVTPMIGINDVNAEQFTFNNVDTLKNFAEKNHLGGLSLWSIARDNPCADKWASPVCSGNNLQQKPYEFSARFLSNSAGK